MAKHYFNILILGLLVSSASLSAGKFQWPSLDTFISDTLYIEVSQDSSIDLSQSNVEVNDSRPFGVDILGIRQTKKYKYIPVDQYLAMDQALADLFKAQFLQDSLELWGTLHISKLVLWTDNLSAQNKGLTLNAYTTYHDSSGNPISDWMWELHLDKKKKKQSEAEYLGEVVQQLVNDQSKALASGDFNTDFYPHLYRRQLMTWTEFIYFKDGYALNVHLTLDFPPDQKSDWKRGAPGLFYRKSDKHESIAIGGKDRQWFRRLNSNWISKYSATFRFGFNNFEGGHFDHLEYWNLIYLNVSSQASIEYRPVYHKGLYGGFGVYGGYNILPDVIPQTEMGLLISVGLLLP